MGGDGEASGDTGGRSESFHRQWTIALEAGGIWLQVLEVGSFEVGSEERMMLVRMGRLSREKICSSFEEELCCLCW